MNHMLSNHYVQVPNCPNLLRFDSLIVLGVESYLLFVIHKVKKRASKGRVFVAIAIIRRISGLEP